MFKYYLKLAIFLLLSSTWINAANASTTLQCEVTSYQQALNSGYTLEWAKSWVPETFEAEIDESGIIRVGEYRKSLISNNDKGNKIEFSISVPNRDDGAVIKGTYFKKKQKFAVKIDYDVRYVDSGLIWGVCKEGTSTQAASSSSTSTETRKGWLGVFIQEITPEIADELDLENDNGALVSLVNSGSPSEKAGIKAGDVIVTFNDKRIEEAFSLPQIIAESSIGNPIDVHIIRQGKKMNLKVTLVALEDAEEAGLLAGTTLSSEYNNINDFAVASKDADPFKKGDKVLRVGQVAVHNVEMFITEISEMKSSGRNTFLLLVDRDNRQRFVNVDFNILTSAFNYNFDMPLATASNLEQSTTPTSSELLAAQQEAEVLKQQLAELQAQQPQTQQATSADTQIPIITITRADTDDKQGIIVGRVSDNVGVAEVTVDGNVVPFSSNGSFEYSTYVPATGLSVVVEVTDFAGLSSTQTITLERNVNLATASISFDRLNPIAKQAKRNNNALALIIGVSDYRNTPAKAIYADTDAMVFRDYASEKLGIPDNRIKTLVNDGADIREFLLSTQNWLSRSVKQDQTDVYVFFAGHGLASDDGEQMYLLPYDGSPELLDRTAILRDELFSDIASANPRSVTVFLDTCYSGSTRGSEMLIAARPILLKAKESAVPEGFTVFTAAAGDETAKPLEEARHGMFSYFLMKGMEGDADTNGDKHITAGELHAYVKSNVVQQSSGTQTPELQGDADRVLVRFQ